MTQVTSVMRYVALLVSSGLTVPRGELVTLVVGYTALLVTSRMTVPGGEGGCPRCEGYRLASQLRTDRT